MASNAAALYARISSNPEQTQALFRQALQDPNLSLIHISEPTRRRGISYAVFCLKKKKKK